MIHEHTLTITKGRNVVKTILSAWLGSGTLDITTASIYRYYLVTPALMAVGSPIALFASTAK
jgi:hypothetical protein